MNFDVFSGFSNFPAVVDGKYTDSVLQKSFSRFIYFLKKIPDSVITVQNIGIFLNSQSLQKKINSTSIEIKNHYYYYYSLLRFQGVDLLAIFCTTDKPFLFSFPIQPFNFLNFGK